jgi:tripartite-type tricarboxylate transporter receptor subunit TctC
MGATRSRFLPEVPTLVEAGFSQMVIFESFGLYVPTRTSADQADRLHDALVKALNASETKATLTTLGMEAKASTSAELESLRKTESEQWGKFVRQIGFKQDT